MCADKCHGPGALDDQFTVVINGTIPGRDKVAEVSLSNMDIDVLKNSKHPMWVKAIELLSAQLTEIFK